MQSHAARWTHFEVHVAAHRSGFDLAGAAIELYIAAHRARSHLGRLPGSAKPDIAAHGLSLQVGSREFGSPIAAHSAEPLRSLYSRRIDIGADYGRYHLASLGHTDSELGIGFVSILAGDNLDGCTTSFADDIHSFDILLER